MFRVWLVIFFLIFSLVELFQWAKDFFLPLPIYILAGAFLAIASNYEKGMVFLLKGESTSAQEVYSQTATLVSPVLDSEQEKINTSVLTSSPQKLEEA